jgi:hypothetical protein
MFTARRPFVSTQHKLFGVTNMTKMLSYPCDYVAGRWVPRLPSGPIQTRDAVSIRTQDPDGLPMNLRDEHVPGRRRTRDDVLTGNTDPQKRISRGTIWTAEGVQPIRDSLIDALTALEGHKNFALGVPLEAEEIGKVIDLAKRWVARAQDALRAAKDQEPREGLDPEALIATSFSPHTQRTELERYRRPGDPPITKGIYPGAEDEERACDLPPEPGGRLDGKPTRDGRAMSAVRPYLPGTNRGITTQQYADNLREGRKPMGTHDQAAPVARARVTAAEFAALHAAKRRT